MKYKVGDKIKIREDLVEGEWYGYEYFSKYMKKFLGKVCTISDINENTYVLEEDDESIKWYWTDEMIERRIEDEV